MLMPYPRVEAIRQSLAWNPRIYVSNVNENVQVLRMPWLIIFCHDIDDFISLFLVLSTFLFLLKLIINAG